MKKIITISREYGAAGNTIGHEVARRLGFQIYDKAIILRGAKNSNMDVESVLEWDEKVQTDFGFAQSLFYNRTKGDKLYEAQKGVMRKFAEHGSCIIVGRNANTILKEFDHSLHVFLSGDEEWRTNWMIKVRADEPADVVRKELKLIDKSRKKFCKFYSQTEFGEAANYDICLNVSKLGVEKCIDIICDLATQED